MRPVPPAHGTRPAIASATMWSAAAPSDGAAGGSNHTSAAVCDCSCRLYGPTLVVTKLDQLARNVAFISKLMESGIDFVAADFPQANRLTVHILAAVAEHAATMISQRTRAALAAAKACGVKLSNPASLHNQLNGRTKGNAAKATKAAKADKRAASTCFPSLCP
jgi:DNA invertase Pin-like site-specific DNA recombinase